MRGLRPACPALWGTRRSQKSKCRAIHTVTRATPPRGARAAVMNSGTQIPRKTQGPQAVARPTPMIWQGRPGMRHLCRRTTSSRLSCDAHNKGQRVVRGQAVGFSRCSIQRVRMGLRATDGAGGCGRLPDTRSPATKTARGIPRTSHCMFMAGQLLHGERRVPHSAGQIF